MNNFRRGRIKATLMKEKTPGEKQGGAGES